ncbi:hypothetical protein VTN02DRAFT_4900 [Thermoascus thermophilus]
MVVQGHGVRYGLATANLRCTQDSLPARRANVGIIITIIITGITDGIVCRWSLRIRCDGTARRCRIAHRSHLSHPQRPPRSGRELTLFFNWKSTGPGHLYTSAIHWERGKAVVVCYQYPLERPLSSQRVKSLPLPASHIKPSSGRYQSCESHRTHAFGINYHVATTRPPTSYRHRQLYVSNPAQRWPLTV